ncbi:Lysophosphatidylcholine_acyltransferase/Lyso-PAF acetyltransferase [Hexamita inflata]|uniref:Lysophosphatidylcholine acyltransferase/Lyso-PAF acetyltransferase n=1 Tax=Hexamita inflata TaxID=28002 RepID=A0AA86NSR8_9EUKA|nr:Lysophosphatidylcholine acyltransferase/Lyso-PAF acetyltransferase [Hexamita inflata]
MDAVSIAYLHETSFLAKHTLKRLFPANLFSRLMDTIFVDRENHKTDFFTQMEKRYGCRTDYENQTDVDVIAATDFVLSPTTHTDLPTVFYSKPTLIYPEGTCANGQSLLQFKTGAFRLRMNVHVISIQYKSIFDCSTCQRKMQYVLKMFTNPLTIVHMDYLAVMKHINYTDPQKFASACQKAIATHQNVQTSKYSQNDFLYFFKNLKNIECTLKRQYAHIGTAKDYKCQDPYTQAIKAMNLPK